MNFIEQREEWIRKHPISLPDDMSDEFKAYIKSRIIEAWTAGYFQCTDNWCYKPDNP